MTNWSVTDTGGVRPLKVAGPGSVRIEEDNPWAVRSGYWEPAPTDGFAFWSQGRAIRASASGASVTIETHCQTTHDIYVGTRLDSNCGIDQTSLDGGAPVQLDCYNSPASQMRRNLFASVAPGQHRVVITLTGNKNAASAAIRFTSRKPSLIPDVFAAPVTARRTGNYSGSLPGAEKTTTPTRRIARSRKSSACP